MCLKFIVLECVFLKEVLRYIIFLEGEFKGVRFKGGGSKVGYIIQGRV